jgi:hypothetical protein
MMVTGIADLTPKLGRHPTPDTRRSDEDSASGLPGMIDFAQGLLYHAPMRIVGINAL